jgi:hypothetical protein
MSSQLNLPVQEYLFSWIINVRPQLNKLGINWNVEILNFREATDMPAIFAQI